MLKYKVVLVPFPFDDLSSSKVRPAVCLTEPIGPHQHVVLAFITSRVPTQPLPSDLVIDSSHTDFGATGLRVASTLQVHRLMTATATLLLACLPTRRTGPRGVHRLMTATTTLLQRELGRLSPLLQQDVIARLKTLFDMQ
jgi:mRNA interferase MazF